jgi:Carbon-nitrogen hydrolase
MGFAFPAWAAGQLVSTPSARIFWGPPSNSPPSNSISSNSHGVESLHVMAAQLINRRKFARLIGNGLTVGSVAGLDRVASAAPRRIRVAAVQMTADLANVDANLSKAERLVRLALKRGARWIVLPEFFTSAIAFHPDMAKATEAVDGRPTELMRKLAREGNAFVGGSFLAWHAGNVYNSFILAFPNGKTLRHDKDYPSFWEACYYVGGNDDGVLSTPDGNVGVALCYAFVRSKTAARLRHKVGMVVGGSCWWGARIAHQRMTRVANGFWTF